MGANKQGEHFMFWNVSERFCLQRGAILRLLVASILAVSVGAQNDQWDSIPPNRIFTVKHTATLSSETMTVTVQSPAAATRQTVLNRAWVYTENSCPVVIERNGAAATGTMLAASTYAVNPGNSDLNVEVFAPSDVGAATASWPVKVPAGGAGSTISLRGHVLRSQGRENISVAIGPCSGEARWLIQGGQR